MITTSLELALATLAAEFALLALALATWMLRASRQQQSAAVETVSALVSQVTQSEAPRREALLTVLRDCYQFDGAEADRVVSDFIEREQAFYNMLIGVHLGRNGKTLADVPTEVTRLVAPWLRLAADAAPAGDPADPAITAELGERKKVLDDLVNEFSSAFLRTDGTAEDFDLRVDEPPAADPAPRELEILEESPAASPAGLRGVPEDQLLSMDEYDGAPPEAPAAASSGAEDDREDVADFPGASGPIIDLSADAPVFDDERLPMSSEDDLDALMQNLALDAAPTAARTQAAA